MHVRWMELAGFRLYTSLSFAPDPGLNVLIGPNGQGKTSLLEALHLLLSGRSFRTPRLVECVGWDATETRVTGEIADGDRNRAVRLEIQSRGPGVELRGALCPWARAVTFGASDIGLVGGAAPGRRAYLDGVAAKLAPAHGDACRRYRLVLQQRGKLLVRLRGRPDGERLLAPWDEQVAALGSEIVHRRLETLATLAEEVRDLGEALGLAARGVVLGYRSSVEAGAEAASTRLRLLAALATGRAKETRCGVTLVGPHRDDLVIRLGRADARTTASRGEQRLLALALRLAEAGVMRRRLGVAPVFLLDDLLSELDGAARARVLAWLAPQGQVLYSTTDPVPRGGLAGTAWEVREAEVALGRAISTRGAA